MLISDRAFIAQRVAQVRPISSDFQDCIDYRTALRNMYDVVCHLGREHVTCYHLFEACRKKTPHAATDNVADCVARCCWRFAGAPNVLDPSAGWDALLAMLAACKLCSMYASKYELRNSDTASLCVCSDHVNNNGFRFSSPPWLSERMFGSRRKVFSPHFTNLYFTCAVTGGSVLLYKELCWICAVRLEEPHDVCAQRAGHVIGVLDVFDVRLHPLVVFGGTRNHLTCIKVLPQLEVVLLQCQACIAMV